MDGRDAATWLRGGASCVVLGTIAAQLETRSILCTAFSSPEELLAHSEYTRQHIICTSWPRKLGIFRL